MDLGRPAEAVPFYTRALAIALACKRRDNASIDYLLLSQIYAWLGELTASADAAREALIQVRQAKNERSLVMRIQVMLGRHADIEIVVLTLQAKVAYLRGDLECAGQLFQQAEALEREIEPGVHYLYGDRGNEHADL